MAFWFNNTRVSVWDVKKTDRSTQVNFTNSSRDKEGNYINDSRGWAFASKAVVDYLDAHPAQDDKHPISLYVDGIFTSGWDKEAQKPVVTMRFLRLGEKTKEEMSSSNNNFDVADEDPF